MSDHILGGSSFMVSNGRIDLGGQTSLHGAVRDLFNCNDAVLVLQPNIMRRDISCEDRKVGVGDLGDMLEQILSQLDWRIALVVAPGGGSALGCKGRISVLAAAQGSVAVTLRARNVFIIDVPAARLRMKRIETK